MTSESNGVAALSAVAYLKICISAYVVTYPPTQAQTTLRRPLMLLTSKRDFAGGASPAILNWVNEGKRERRAICEFKREGKCMENRRRCKPAAA